MIGIYCHYTVSMSVYFILFPFKVIFLINNIILLVSQSLNTTIKNIISCVSYV